MFVVSRHQTPIRQEQYVAPLVYDNCSFNLSDKQFKNKHHQRQPRGPSGSGPSFNPLAASDRQSPSSAAVDLHNVASGGVRVN
jgi:hypothetical protein